MLRLAITVDDRVRHVPLAHGPLRLGSAPENEIVLATTGVSRRHAVIERTPEGVVITDANSKNGIVVGDRRVRSARLRPGVKVGIGAASLVLEDVSTSDADLALRLMDESSSTGGFGARETDSAPYEQRESGPAAALAWARKVERRSREEVARDLVPLLDEARRIIHADALLLVEVRAGDLVVIAASGPLPEDNEAMLLAEGAAAMWLRIGRLAARIPSASRSAWKREFLEFVDVRVSEVSSRTPAPRTPVQAKLPSGLLPGTSSVMNALLSDVDRVAAGSIDVLLSGETGSGKELIARAIHTSSPRHRGPFVAVNCAAVAKELLEAELFGIGRGVATGVDARPGLFLAANGGTIFLDEISEMPESLQAKLLRVLQEREVLAVGATKPRPIDVRVISSTNRDLAALVRAGAFRADLYYRIHVIELRVPPLRSRREDIGELIYTFTRAAATASRKRIRGISRGALRRLIEHDWPGNVRELRNTIEAAVVRCPDGAPIEEVHLELPAAARVAGEAHPLPAASARTLGAQVENVERDAIVKAIVQCGGNKSKAAKVLGITRAGLYLKMKRHGLK